MTQEMNVLKSRIAIALILSASITCAQGAGLVELYEEAKVSDTLYAAAKADREAVESLLTQTKGQLLPQIGLSGSQIKNDMANEIKGTRLGDRSTEYEFTAKSGSLNLTQALFRPQLWIAYSQSKSQVRQAEGQLRQAKQDLILRLAQAYFDVLQSEDNVRLAAEQNAAIAEQLKQAKRYFEAGVGTITDINEAQARFDTILAQELAAQNSLEIKIRSLELVVGNVHRKLDQLGPGLALETPKPAVIDTWLEFSLANNPALKAKEAAFEVAQQEVYKNFAAHMPTADIVAGRGRTENGSFTMIDNVQWNNTIGIQVSIPLFSSGVTQGRVNQSSALKDKARYELEGVQRASVLATRQEYLNVMNGVAQVKALEQAVKSNELALYSARKGQEAGLRTSFDVLNAQQLLFSAKRDLAQARYGYVMSRLKLRSAAGLLNEDDVVLVQHWLEK